MDDEEVQKQLDHMIKFIYREAEEKASEIQAKAMEEFSIEKSRLVQEGRVQIAREYEKKEKQIEVQKKISYSNELNQSRLTALKHRDDGIQKLKHEAHKKLGNVSKDANSYKKLVEGLITQGLLKLQEPKVSIICRKQDLSLVQGVLTSSVAEYTKKSGKKVDCTVDSINFLPPGPVDGSSADFCSGGIVLSSNEGRIICSNTLDDRLFMAFEQNLPDIRTLLFGESTTRKHKD